MYFYGTKNVELIESTILGRRSYIQFTGSSYVADLKQVTARDDVKKFIEKIDVSKCESSFRITCLEEGKEQTIDKFGGIEVSVELLQHKESKHSTINCVILFSNENYKKILHQIMLCRDMTTEFEMSEILNVKFKDEDEYSKCEMMVSLQSYKLSKIYKQIQ